MSDVDTSDDAVGEMARAILNSPFYAKHEAAALLRDLAAERDALRAQLATARAEAILSAIDTLRELLQLEPAEGNLRLMQNTWNGVVENCTAELENLLERPPL